jgi:hypothetical protein
MATSGWTLDTISPGELPTPPGFLTPEEVAAQSAAWVTPKTISANDFLTTTPGLRDPKLASRTYSSVPQTLPKEVAATASVYGTSNVPAFLTQAVNDLNQTQSSKAALQEQYRQKLLEAVLGGNYLAAEALRAASVTPGAKVGFASAVQNPQMGQAAVVNAVTNREVAKTQVDLARQPLNQQTLMQQELNQVQKKIANTPFGGPEKAALTSRQYDIQRELKNLQTTISGATNASAWVPRTGLGR